MSKGMLHTTPRRIGNYIQAKTWNEKSATTTLDSTIHLASESSMAGSRRRLMRLTLAVEMEIPEPNRQQEKPLDNRKTVENKNLDSLATQQRWTGIAFGTTLCCRDYRAVVAIKPLLLLV